MSITAAMPVSSPFSSATTGMPPPPTEITTKRFSIRERIASTSTMRIGSGEGTTRRQPRPASSCTDQPSSSRRRIASASSMNEPIGFDGLWKAGSSRRHLHLGHDGDRVAVDVEPVEVVLEVLRQGVADRALAVGAADVERHLVQLVRRELGAPQDEADLRAVAVADRHVPAVLDHRGDVPAGLAGRDVLVAHRLVLLVLDQRVAADRDDGALAAHRSSSKPPIVRAISALPVCIRFSASSKTTDCGPSMTSSVTSRPRSAGRQCM